ncbi:uncharacterized protein LOC100902688 [Galendromus occidentalis]|uniref:Uncharacterized protein LOC100902688 n=1 Tax=Galendromus occidentalis TaxID=34638 RepID=A0AAJ6VWY9_9ACAR|nr:uncharacterized protein LOC100902688 [Galendromus occidentalis]
MKRNRLPSHPAIALLACAVLCGTLAHATKAQDMMPELKAGSAVDGPENPLSELETLQNCLSLLDFLSQDPASLSSIESPVVTLCASIVFGDSEANDELDSNVIFGTAKRDMQKQKFLHFGRKRREVKGINDVKRQSGQSRVLHFGKRTIPLNAEEQTTLRQLNDLFKRSGQNRILHFGKRTPNRFIHFGKRATNRFLHFGKRDFESSEPEKRSSKFMHFGKRDDEETDAIVNYDMNIEDELIKRAPPNSRFIHFGKRSGPESIARVWHHDDVTDSDRFVDELFKRSPANPNRYLHFGKKATSKFMHFGKRALAASSGMDSSSFDENTNEEALNPDLKERKRRTDIGCRLYESRHGSENLGTSGIIKLEYSGSDGLPIAVDAK